jgi:hypothetical protein
MQADELVPNEPLKALEKPEYFCNRDLDQIQAEAGELALGLRCFRKVLIRWPRIFAELDFDNQNVKNILL